LTSLILAKPAQSSRFIFTEASPNQNCILRHNRLRRSDRPLSRNMAFCITFGTHNFQNQLQGYEGVTAQCHNCGNWSARCQTSWEWITICFLPVIPLSLHKYSEVACPICNFKQDLKNRPDVQSQHSGAGGGPPLQQGPPAQYGGPQGWNAQPQPQAPAQYK